MISLSAIGTSILPHRFKTTGYIKSKFSVIKNDNEEWNKAFFSITDDVFKMEVTINSYKENKFEKGEHVELIGSIYKLKNDEITFKVEKMSDVRKFDDDVKLLNWLLEGRTTIYSSTYSSGLNKRQKTE
ncbi:uncharacterized protein LOC123270552 isoform X1 [Cotesia glomerata]|uniref:Uncharacterized protein n=1 Tax=Cotesia glomerata TaxID=32391 RepID=A0AAV7IJA8_COTGL|nr:uncharacterized protein LOC123270552 isoform X1 [Cotesia glomerata]KAH0552509.1 hypothetical protein KQX54_011395 [Cotesia glomerata]